jgi:hypothetical protein
MILGFKNNLTKNIVAVKILIMKERKKDSLLKQV